MHDFLNLKKGVVSAATLLFVSVAAEAQSQKEWRDSLSVLNSKIALTPNDADLRLRKAAVNIELGQWDYAIDEYGRVLDIDPKNLSAHYFRAYAYSSTQRYDLARLDYEAVLSQVPRHFEAQLGLALVKRKQGRSSETLDELNKIVQMFPDSAIAYAARASYEAELHFYEISLYDWDEAIRRDPLRADYVVSKADILISLRRTDEARATLNEAANRGIPKAALREWLKKCK